MSEYDWRLFVDDTGRYLFESIPDSNRYNYGGPVRRPSGSVGVWQVRSVAGPLKLCPHVQVVPVELSLPPHELVAQLCVECLGQLPPEWGCPDCDYIDLIELGSPTTGRVMGKNCPRHQNG